MSEADSTPLFFEPWIQFKTPIVRQLAFCISSPNILSQKPHELVIKNNFELHDDHHWQVLYQSYEARLFQLDDDPSPLIEFIARLKSTRLGLRFENLLWFWLLDQDFHHYQLLGHSIQIINGAVTIGELDFLVLNQRSNEIEHWEVALKYYLGEMDLELKHWYGLNRQDTLNRKLQHFTERQFQFSEINDYKIQRKFCVLKGQLYLPTVCNGQRPLPTWINNRRRIGKWGTHIPIAQYHRLQRHEWLCPNREVSSTSAKWWTDGLYHDPNSEPQFYMFRTSLFKQT